MNKKLISIISPCYNEADNVEELYRRVINVINELDEYNFEYLFIDNASTDSTVDLLKSIAANDKRVKLIVNNRNFGHIRSPYWGIMQTSGDATIYLASDLQDPPELIFDFLKYWSNGYKLVMASKPVSEENKFFNFCRRSYYRLLDSICEFSVTRDVTGFGLYDKKVIDEVKKINDPYPYFRGLIDELGFRKAIIEFVQPKRKNGISNNNIFSLCDYAILGVINHSIIPIRVITYVGLLLVIVCVVAFCSLLSYYTFYYKTFELTTLILLFICLLISLLMISVGVVGEYVVAILRYVRKRPILVERERLNF